MSRISIVIPVYNSEHTLDELYQRLIKVFSEAGLAYEIVMVDDGSVDRSLETMKRLGESDAQLVWIQLTRNFGQQNALMCGLHHVSGEIVITLDDDLQHPPEEILRLIQPMEFYDVVFGIPREKRHSRYRNIGSKLVSYLLGWLTGQGKTIQVSSFRALKRSIVQEIIKEERSFVYLTPLIFKATRRVGQTEARHEPRKVGRSNYNFYKLARLVVKLVVNYAKPFCWLPHGKQPQFVIKEMKDRR